MEQKKWTPDEELVKNVQAAQDRVKSFRRNSGRSGDEKCGGFVLRLIHMSEGGLNPSDICAQMNVTMPRVTTILNSLEKDGLIERVISKQDRRRLDVHITKEGACRVEEYLERRRQRTVSLLEKIGPEDSQALLRILKAKEELGE